MLKISRQSIKICFPKFINQVFSQSYILQSLKDEFIGLLEKIIE